MRESGEQIFLDAHGGGDVHGGGDHVVGALLHVDVIVGMDGVFAAAFTGGELVGAAGDDLVGVHVGAGAGAGLENVDDELGVELAVDDFGGGGLDEVAFFGVDEAELRIG